MEEVCGGVPATSGGGLLFRGGGGGGGCCDCGGGEDGCAVEIYAVAEGAVSGDSSPAGDDLYDLRWGDEGEMVDCIADLGGKVEEAEGLDFSSQYSVVVSGRVGELDHIYHSMWK